MNNKKIIIINILFLIIFLIVFNVISINQYNTYSKNYNNKINSIINKINKEYPKVSNNEIMDILNSNNEDEDVLKKYDIDIHNESAILKNEKLKIKYTITNTIVIVVFIIITYLLFYIHDRSNSKKIKKIINTLEEINKKNYLIDINDMGEGELSILQNDLYKTTILLKEEASNSLNDKIELKKSLSDISHQLKTPLTSILIMLDNIIDNPEMDNETKKEFIYDIKREITNINFLIQNLLKLSKLDTNSVVFNNKENSVEDIVDESIKKLSMISDLHDVKIKVINNNSSTIICDYKWQVEAITNIIKNCIEHTKDKIEIVLDSNKVYESITIKDNGKGIDKEDIKHIFERFYRGKNSSFDSVGIGLSLAKTIIEQNNGIVIVDSNKKGTTFIVKYMKN